MNSIDTNRYGCFWKMYIFFIIAMYFCIRKQIRNIKGSELQSAQANTFVVINNYLNIDV